MDCRQRLDLKVPTVCQAKVAEKARWLLLAETLGQVPVQPTENDQTQRETDPAAHEASYLDHLHLIGDLPLWARKDCRPDFVTSENQARVTLQAVETHLGSFSHDIVRDEQAVLATEIGSFDRSERPPSHVQIRDWRDRLGDTRSVGGFIMFRQVQRCSSYAFPHSFLLDFISQLTSSCSVQ